MEGHANYNYHTIRTGLTNRDYSSSHVFVGKDEVLKERDSFTIKIVERVKGRLRHYKLRIF